MTPHTNATWRLTVAAEVEHFNAIYPGKTWVVPRLSDLAPPFIVFWHDEYEALEAAALCYALEPHLAHYGHQNADFCAPEVRQRSDGLWALWVWARRPEFMGVSDAALPAHCYDVRQWVCSGVFDSEAEAWRKVGL